MCRPNGQTLGSTRQTSTLSSPAATESPSTLWSVYSPWLVAAGLLCLPKWCFLNRGYTQWFHWNSFCFIFTQNDWHAQFLAVQGFTVTLGWYASLLYDWYANGRFAHILYWNMPEIMTRHMMTADERVMMMYGPVSVGVMCLAHLFDTLGHPVLAYYFWNRSVPKHDDRDDRHHEHPKSYAWVDRFPWSVLICSYSLSRIWSLVHTWHNHGRPTLFYFGYDVYTILDRECWMEGLWLPAYVTEAVVYLVFVVGKIFLKAQKKRTTHSSTKPTLDRIPSTLLQSTVSEATAATTTTVTSVNDDEDL